MTEFFLLRDSGTVVRLVRRSADSIWPAALEVKVVEDSGVIRLSPEDLAGLRVFLQDSSEYQRGLRAGERLAEVRHELGMARRHRARLDLPLTLHPGKPGERVATPEEVSTWQAAAEEEIRRLEAEVQKLEAG